MYSVQSVHGTCCTVLQPRTDQPGVYVFFYGIHFHRKFRDVSMLTLLIEGEMPSVATCSVYQFVFLSLFIHLLSLYGSFLSIAFDRFI